MIVAFALVGLLSQDATQAPPSTVLVPGGRTRIGLDVKEIERLILDDPEAIPFAGTLIAETPRFEAQVDACWMMVTEVTQEQYGRFVRATHALPLMSWCEAALTQAAAEFAASTRGQGAEDGQPKRTFDRRTWWNENASRVEWAIPPEDRLRPVVFVDYAAARAYARWAGMRLPTEFEYQRAVKGDSSQTYPWGNEWDDQRFAATAQLAEKGGTFPVGSFPSGRSRQRIFDLVGNVWEWTTSPFVKFPGYDLRVFEVGYGRERHSVNAIADWNPEQRVVVGGSFLATRLMCRPSVRRGTDRTQSASALGFRCAATPHAGVDLARYVLEDDFDPRLRPRSEGAPLEFAVEATSCVDGWVRSTSEGAPEGYAIAEDYRYVLFVPVARVPIADPASLERKSLEDPLVLGILATNVPLEEPALDPGAYLIRYRARGLRRLGRADAASAADFGRVPLEEALHLDVALDHLIVTDLRGTPVTALQESVGYGALREAQVSSVARGDSRGRSVRFELTLPCLTSNKGLAFVLDLATEPLAREPDWRR